MSSQLGIDLFVTGIIVANGLVFLRRAERVKREHPERGSEPVRVANGFMFWLVPLFALSGVGDAFGWSGLPWPPRRGQAPSWWDFTFAATFCLLLARGCVWIYRGDGAAVLARNHDVLSPIPRSATGVRVWWSIIVAVSVVGMWVHLSSG